LFVVTGALPPSSSKIPTLEEALAEIAELRAANEQLQAMNASLRHQLDVLSRRMFQRKTDQLNPAQLKLALEQLKNETGAADEPVEMDSGELVVKEHRRKKTGRQQIPASLPRRIVSIEPSEEDRRCGCGQEKARILEEQSEKLNYIPATFEVVRTVRGVWACQKCHDGVTIAPLPPQAVEKGLAAEGLLAQVVTAKFADHQPLHRQKRIYARSGLDLSVSTMCGWVAAVADALSPIVDHLRERLISSSYLQTDDTPITVLADDGQSFKGRIWTYYDPIEQEVVFDATETHHSHWPQQFLAGFKGYLQADAYTGYDALYTDGSIVEVGCWAHARRRFVDAAQTAPEAARMVALVAQLYAVEETLRGLTAEERYHGRLARSSPIIERIQQEHDRLRPSTLPKSPLGDALRYMKRQWNALVRFLDDGRLLPDNNNAERQLRTVALGRKNWLFAGSLAGAKRAAILYSLVQSCRLAGIDCWTYFHNVLIEVATMPHSRIHELTPSRWATDTAAELGIVRP
jgi:transposase